jgi:AAA15 family ATPase/GTPase
MRTAIVRAAGIPRPVPLRSFGDGLNRLFGIVLSLVNAKDGLLLIDEFENGLHHSIQVDIWRAVFRLAGSLDIQVVATSHSWDAIEAFQKAASEDPEEGVLIRLSRKGEEIIPTLFREDELAVVTRDRIEVR